MADTENTQPALGTPEYNDMMAQVAEQHDKETGVQPEASEREDWLPEGVNSREELLEAFNKMKAEKTVPQKPEQPDEPADPDSLEVIATRDQAAQYLKTKGLDISALETEYMQTGTLGEDAYRKLAKAGFPRVYVNEYLSGMRAMAEQSRNDVMNMVGGEEAYLNMVEWAKTSLGEQEIVAYNRVMKSGDLEMIKLAAAGLKARYSSAVNEPGLVMGRTASPTSGAAFETDDEIVAAMRDPRYKNDPAYRRQTMQRVMNSKTL